MKLNDKAIQALKEPGKYADGAGLYVQLHKNGSKYWRMKYRFMGKEKLLSFGVYPTLSLKDARQMRDEAKLLLTNGSDPGLVKKEQKHASLEAHANNFEAIALEWHAKKKGDWTERHAHYVLTRIKADLFSIIGPLPITDIAAPILLSALRKVEDRGALDIAKRLLQTSGQIFRYAVATGRAERDITSDLKGALATRKQQHYAYLQEQDIPEFLEKLKIYDGELLTQLAIHLLFLTFVRTQELRGAKWEEFDLEKRIWTIPAERMKMKMLHKVPLSDQVLSIIQRIRQVHSNEVFLFPNTNNSKKEMSNNTILYALYRMGYHGRLTGHGFRATASTILHENGFNSDIIERQLAHAERNKVKGAYDHSTHIAQRTKMMQWWGDYLDNIGPI